MKAVIINGGNAITSRVTAVEQFAFRFLRENEVDTEVIIVNELPATDLITANYTSEAIKKVNAIVEEADILIVLTPIYKAAYSGILKTYLDLLPQKALENKSVIPIAVGGSFNHLLAVDYALKPVLSVLGATEISKSVYILDKQIRKNEDQSFSIESEIEERLLIELQGTLSLINQKVKTINA